MTINAARAEATWQQFQDSGGYRDLVYHWHVGRDTEVGQVIVDQVKLALQQLAEEQQDDDGRTLYRVLTPSGVTTITAVRSKARRDYHCGCTVERIEDAGTDSFADDVITPVS